MGDVSLFVSTSALIAILQFAPRMRGVIFSAWGLLALQFAPPVRGERNIADDFDAILGGASLQFASLSGRNSDYPIYPPLFFMYNQGRYVWKVAALETFCSDVLKIS